MRFFHYALLMVVGALMAPAMNSCAQPTAFSYQGSLSVSGSPANGVYDFTFALLSNTNYPAQAGSTITNLGVVVTNGVFTTFVDAGSNATAIFNGQALWLQVGVRNCGSSNDFALLHPMQTLTASPYAITAGNLPGTLPASQLSGTLPASVFPATLPALNGINLTNVVLSTVTPGAIAGGIVSNALSLTNNSNIFYGNFNGNFSGVYNGPVSDASLSNDVQLYGNPLDEVADGGYEHTLRSINTLDGSTFSLIRNGTSGYADVNFFTGLTLRFAMGVGVPGTAGDDPNAEVYETPYLEQFNQEPFWWIRYGDYRGGFRGNGNFVMFYSGQNQPTTNQVMLEVDRASNTITNYSPVTFAQPPTFQTTNIAPSGVIWGTTPPDLWIPVTNNGQTFMMPAWRNH